MVVDDDRVLVLTFMYDCRFDENSSLRCEMARKNMYIRDMEPNKRARPNAPPATVYVPRKFGLRVFERERHADGEQTHVDG